MTATTERPARMTKAAMQARIEELAQAERDQAQTTGTLLDRIAQLEKQRDELLAALRAARRFLRSRTFDPAMRDGVSVVVEAAIYKATGAS